MLAFVCFSRVWTFLEDSDLYRRVSGCFRVDLVHTARVVRGVPSTIVCAVCCLGDMALVDLGVMAPVHFLEELTRDASSSQQA